MTQKLQTKRTSSSRTRRKKIFSFMRKEVFVVFLILPVFLLVLSRVWAANSTTTEQELIQQKCEEYAIAYPEQKLPDICGQSSTVDSASPTPTMNPTASPSGMPTEHTPEVTHVPTPLPSTLPSQDQTVTYCTNHSTTEFHGVYNQLENCWYDHEHGDDPTSVDDIFGSPSSWWGGSQEISYPWQTYGFSGNMTGGGDNFPAKTGLFENEGKHEGYKWHVRRDIPCYSKFAGGCITALRALDHADATHGIYVRFHSFSVEMVVCNELRPTDCGILRTAGWADKGNLAIDGVIIPGYGPTAQNGGTRLHYFSRGNKDYGTWYGGSKKAEVVTQFEDMWVTVNPTDLNTLIFRCPQDPANCGYNSSKRELHLVGAMITPQEVRWLRQQGFASTSGKINFKGYTDRYGIIVKDGHCTEVALDCVPIEYVNYDASVLYQYRGDAREYDTSIGVLENSPIRHPN